MLNKNRSVFIACTLALQVFVPIEVTSATAVPESKLLLNEELIVDLPGNIEGISYQFTPTESGYYLIQVSQLGLDLKLEVSSSKTKSRVYDSPLQRQGDEYAVVNAEKNEPIKLRVNKMEPIDTIGGYLLSVRTIAENDIARHAWQKVSEASSISMAEDASNWEIAATKYEEAANKWRGIGEITRAAYALHCAAALRYLRGYEWPEARLLAETAAEIYQKERLLDQYQHVQHLVAETLLESAQSEKRTDLASSMYLKARRLFTNGLHYFQEQGDGNYSARGLNSLGLLDLYRKRFNSARKQFDLAAASYSSANNRLGLFQALTNRATIETFDGYHEVSIPIFENALSILPLEGFLPQKAVANNSLAIAYARIGRPEQALRKSQNARKAYRETSDKGELHSVWALARAYTAVGNASLAQEHLVEALHMSDGDQLFKNAIRQELGDSLYRDHQFSLALKLHQEALKEASNPYEKAHLLLRIGREHSSLGHQDDAMAAIKKAVAYSSRSESKVLRAEVFAGLGSIYFDIGRHQLALENLKQAQSIYLDLGDPISIADSSLKISQLYQRTGEHEFALEHGEKALEKVFEARTKVTNPKMRALFAASQHTIIENQVDILLDRHETDTSRTDRIKKALETNERARSSMILAITEDASYRSATDEQRSKQSILIKDMSGLRSQLSTKEDLENISEKKNKLRALEVELDIHEGDMRDNLQQVDSGHLDFDSMQSLLDDDTTLLQYALGNKNSYVWIVTNSNVNVVELGQRETIDTAAKSAISALRSSPISRNKDAFQAEISELSQLVLMPILDQLRTTKIIIAPDGILQYVPFSVLPMTSKSASTFKTQFLIEKYKLINIPSISAIWALRKINTSAPSKQLAIFADPIFQSNDARLERLGVFDTKSPRYTNASISKARLSSTLREAKAIESYVESHTLSMNTGFQATKNRFLSSELHQYRYIHIATHSTVDSRYPELSNLAFSSFDSSGTELNGTLQMHEIYQLRFSADLVTLSACDTALGKSIRGEGLVGFTQSFYTAGAKRLLLSLWKVPDRATSTLMKIFYRNLLVLKQNPARALQQAQTELSKSNKWSNPHYWGAFVLSGEWQ